MARQQQQNDDEGKTTNGQPQAPELSPDALMRHGAFMFAGGMGFYAWRVAHQPVGPVLVMVAGVALSTWLGLAVWVWLLRHVRWHRITGDAGVVGIMAGKNGVSVGFYRRHVWLWKRPERASALAVDPSRSTPHTPTDA